MPHAPKTDWRPSANLANLKKRAHYLQAVRAFFTQRNAFEVDTPCLGFAPVSDPFLEAFEVNHPNSTQNYYLQTSPEYYMKRLLAAGVTDCFYLGKCFRVDEVGRHHQPEFTLLEWYRLHWDIPRLIDEIDQLWQQVFNFPQAKVTSYQHCFEHYLNINPHTIDLKSLHALWQHHCRSVIGDVTTTKTALLQMLFSEMIEPHLGQDCPIFITDYPVEQAALAQTGQDSTGQNIANRFEGFYRGVELANGYLELTDANEQAHRFKQDMHIRKQHNLNTVPTDHAFLAAMQNGLPPCAGVAIGFDRLVMLSLDKNSLHDIVSFSL